MKDVLEMLGSGMTEPEILEQFPYLEREDIQAACEYAAQYVNHPVVTAVK